jgi:hypothetical protein
LWDCFKGQQGRRAETAEACCELAITTIDAKIDVLKRDATVYETQILTYMGEKRHTAAVHALRRKKHLHKIIEQLTQHRFNVEQQALSLQQANTNKEVFATMRKVTKALKLTTSRTHVSAVDDTFDDLQTYVDDSEEITQAMQTPLHSMVEMDEVALRMELGIEDDPPRPPQVTESIPFLPAPPVGIHSPPMQAIPSYEETSI